MSIAGGHYKAVLAAHRAGCDTVQLFTKSNSQWRAKALTDQDVQRFKLALEHTGIRAPTAHACYLINLASPEAALWRKSVATFVVELRRCAALGIGYLVLHPGSARDGALGQGLRRVARAIDRAWDQAGDLPVQLLLETTAGQGTSVGFRFEQLAEIIGRVRCPERLGVCFDTCHVFAAGYSMATRQQYRETMEQLARSVGLARLKVFHLNDSKRPLGSRVDRHEHIGRGHLGLAPFRFLLRDVRFRRVPMYLETPKARERGRDMDVVNLRTLRRLGSTA